MGKKDKCPGKYLLPGSVHWEKERENHQQTPGSPVARFLWGIGGRRALALSINIKPNNGGNIDRNAPLQNRGAKNGVRASPVLKRKRK